MKKMGLIICVLISALMFSMVSYAGQWKQDDKGYWYQNDDGSYKVGWHQDIDGKWYYLDDQTGYMLLNTSTPDGLIVNEKGEWMEGMEKTINSEKLYDNNVEFVVPAYSSSPAPPEKFNQPIPVTVYYNNQYINDFDKVYKITGFELSKDGILYAKYEVSEMYHFYGFDILTRYIYEDGTYTDIKRRLSKLYTDDDPTSSGPIMASPYNLKEDPVSAEVYIDAKLKI